VPWIIQRAFKEMKLWAVEDTTARWTECVLHKAIAIELVCLEKCGENVNVTMLQVLLN
jgi:hypothetical protein